jgi:asparagine synthase (glutamine-hydrolysing)
VPAPQPFWFPERVAPSGHTTADLHQQGRELFRDAVALCLRSDVPVGVCLSGGLDSTAIFGQAQQLHTETGHAIAAFSAAFDDRRFDERPYIDTVLRAFNGRGFYCFPSADDFVHDCDRWIVHHDEPPATLSQYAAWSVMRLAREHGVPVLLNGQGGDELFAGYWSAYYLFLRQTLRRAPQHIVTHLVGSLLPGGNATLVSQLVPHWRQYRHRSASRNQHLLQPHWRTHAASNGSQWPIAAQALNPAAYRLHEIRHVHLPRLLKWDDRNSMAFSIEGRYPLLDYRLVEWALSVPPEANLSRGWNKLLFRDTVRDVLPPPIRWRRSKVGFETPQSEWIRGSLRAVLRRWATRPSPRLRELVAVEPLRRLADDLDASTHVDRRDERQLVLLRLYFLDRWLNLFNVEIRREQPGATAISA